MCRMRTRHWRPTLLWLATTATCSAVRQCKCASQMRTMQVHCLPNRSTGAPVGQLLSFFTWRVHLQLFK